MGYFVYIYNILSVLAGIFYLEFEYIKLTEQCSICGNGGFFLTIKDSPYIIASVDRALELLQILGKNSRDLGVTELSKILGVQKSTVHSLLQTMLRRGFIEQTENSRYTLGVGLIQLGVACAERLDIKVISHPIMTDLAEETGEIAILAVLMRDELIIIDKVEPQRPFVIPKFDLATTMHSTAIGKVLLAHASDLVVETILGRGLERHTNTTLIDRDALLDNLEQVRRQGYAVGCNETIDGITCIAVPIYDAGGKVMAALSVSSASSRLTADRYEAAVRTLQAKASLISKKLGCHN